MIVDVGTRYVIEHREPHIGEWVVLPGPIYTMILDTREALAQTVCAVVIGTLTIGISEPNQKALDALKELYYQCSGAPNLEKLLDAIEEALPNKNGTLTYDVRPMPDTRVDGHMTPPPIYYDPARLPGGLGNV